MTDDEILSHLGKIEIREGKERTIKSYVLRNNVISPKAEGIIGRYMEKYGFFYEDSALDYEALFGNANPVVIEIGFGMGDTTAEVAIRRPEFNYIGIEVFLRRGIHADLPLGHQEHVLIGLHSPFQGCNGDPALHIEGQAHMGKHRQAPQGQDGNIHGLQLFFHRVSP